MAAAGNLENPKQAPTILGASKYRYVFKSRAGEVLANKGYDYYFDAYDPKWDEPDDLPEQKRWAKLARANWAQRNPDKEWQATLARAFEANKFNRKLTFRSNRTPEGRVCILETNNPDIAAVIRNGIKKGDLNKFYEENNDRYLLVGEKAFAANTIGRELAFTEAERTGEAIVPQIRD
jgi:hypothetical protein